MYSLKKKRTSQSSLQNETRAAWTCWEISRVKRLELRPEALIYTKQSCLLPSTVATPLPLRGRHGGELSKLSKPWLVDCCTCGKRVRVACHSHRVCVSTVGDAWRHHHRQRFLPTVPITTLLRYDNGRDYSTSLSSFKYILWGFSPKYFLSSKDKRN